MIQVQLDKGQASSFFPPLAKYEFRNVQDGVKNSEAFEGNGFFWEVNLFDHFE